MSLNTLIDNYKQIKMSEPTVVRARDNAGSAGKMAETLLKEIEKKKQKLSQLQQEAQSLKNQLKPEIEALEKITKELEGSAVDPQDLIELETGYGQLAAETNEIKKKSEEFDDSLKNIMNRLTDPYFQYAFKQLKDVTLTLKKEIDLKKRRLNKKKELQQKKNKLEFGSKKTSASIQKIKKTYGQDIEKFQLCQKESRKIEKKRTALIKKDRKLSVKIKQLKKKSDSNTGGE